MTQTTPIPTTTVPILGSSPARSAAFGHALWMYTDHGWTLKKDVSIEGACPSEPPTQPGLFRGQIRATPSVAS